MIYNDDIKNRFLIYVQKTDYCWNWTGVKIWSGYGRFNINRKKLLAHRVSYELFKDIIPKELVIDHLCKNRLCVNPDHLEVVTYKENSIRSDSPWAINARKTQCNKGHLFDQENTYIDPNNNRVCKICRRNRLIKHRKIHPRKIKVNIFHNFDSLSNCRLKLI